MASAAAAMMLSSLWRPPLPCSARSRSFASFRQHGSLIVDNAVLRLSSKTLREKGIGASFRCSAALTPELKSTLDKVVSSHKVVLFMKGTKEFPQCGFSHTVVQILKSLNVGFETLNILENENLRQGLKEYSNWPTFPQLYIDGEFFGGCDITVEAYKTGELQELLEKVMCS
ncbi:monothiol glutaredoxin-S14, chloroplastic isoform X2 [Nymphaea colorata]|uniref:monothiol glutaredoxin-S14, chloroplastic isoform X2 n=1 Tax=Nymphaea colorata TaxID=210225 RepID=UPI00129DB5D5|nr:monothiol glutaredoxin-S14, chloroplastic isoform X2 [Nymphaea colorata]